MELSIRIPKPAQQRYLRGGCFAFAHELRRHVAAETGIRLPLHALWVDGSPEHAFLIDPDRGVAYDARGGMPIDAAVIGEGSMFAGAGSIDPITIAEMRRWARSMDGRNAKKDIGLYVSIIHDES